MKVLFVTPIKEGSGETITCLHIAERLAAAGHQFLFLASPFAQKFIGSHFPEQVRLLNDDDAKANQHHWKVALESFCPDIIVIADYPLLFFPGGTSPLVEEPGWVESLDEVRAQLVTLDHFGFAQRAMGLYLGPPHLNLSYLNIPAIPDKMEILLPCPMNEPGPVDGRRGRTFRYWEVPFRIPRDKVRAVRQRYLDHDENDFMIFHSVPNWAWRYAERLQLPFYHFLPEILEYYLADISRPITFISVNNGYLFQDVVGGRLQIRNLPPLPKTEFEDLLFSADLVLTENSLSISMGKAVCGFQPCAVLKNSFRLLELTNRLSGKLLKIILAMESVRLGSVYPYEVFPSVVKQDLEAIGLYHQNQLAECFFELELFGDEATKVLFKKIIDDQDYTIALREKQERYLQTLQQTPDAVEVLEALLEKKGGEL